MDEELTPFNQILDNILGDDDVSIPNLFRLSDMSDQDRTLFETLWSETSNTRKRVVVQHLADLSEENFYVEFGPIFALCLNDESNEVKIAALDGLWDTTDTTLIPAMLNALENDPTSTVRRSAAGALAHFVLMGEWDQIPASTQKSVVSKLLERYQEGETDDFVRAGILEALGSSSQPEISSLIEAAYESGNNQLQTSALFAMGNSADPRWMSIVLGELESPYSDMRQMAARAAGEIGKSDAIEQLGELIYDEEFDIRTEAVVALGKIGGEMSERILSELADDPDAEDLHELIDEVLEEIDWMTGDINLLDTPWDDLSAEDE